MKSSIESGHLILAKVLFHLCVGGSLIGKLSQIIL